MPIKLIATDMDGTLLMPGKIVGLRAHAALHQAQQLGARVVLISGRMTEAMLDTARALSVNAPIIAYNGGEVYDVDASRILHQVTMPADVARELCAFAEGLGLHAQAYSGGAYHAAAENQYTIDYARVIRVAAHVVDMPLSQWIACDQVKVLIISEPERIAAAVPLFRERFQGRANCVNSIPTFIECIAPSVDKGVALRALAEELGIAPDEILAFGDGENDIEMLQYAGHGYAMANAPATVIAAAKHTAPPNDQDGVGQIVEAYIAKGRIGH